MAFDPRDRPLREVQGPIPAALCDLDAFHPPCAPTLADQTPDMELHTERGSCLPGGDPGCAWEAPPVPRGRPGRCPGRPPSPRSRSRPASHTPLVYNGAACCRTPHRSAAPRPFPGSTAFAHQTTSHQPPASGDSSFFSFLFFVPFATRRCEPSACCGPRRRAGAAAGAPRTTDQSPAPSPAAGRCPSPARAPWLTALPPPPATAPQRQNRCASERLATPLEGEGVSEGARRMLRRGEDERRRSARQPAPPSRAPASGALRMAPDPVPLCPSTPSVCLPAPHPARSARPARPARPAPPPPPHGAWMIAATSSWPSSCAICRAVLPELNCA